MKVLSEPVDRETEISEENPPTTDVLPEREAATVASPPTLAVSATLASPSPRLEEARAVEAPLIEDDARSLALLVLRGLTLRLRCLPRGDLPRTLYSDYFS